MSKFFNNFLYVFLCMSIFLFVGCVKEKDSDKEVIPSYIVTDVTGTQIAFTKKPERIVSLSLSADEILLDLVAENRIAALTDISDDVSISPISEKAKKISGRIKGNNAEGILALNPDLIIIADWSGQEAVNSLRGIGLKVYVYKTPTSLKEIEENIMNLADVVGEKDKGKEIVAKMRSDLESVKKKTSKVSDNNRLTVIAWSPTGMFGTAGTTFSDICIYAGLKNGFSDVTGNISEEHVVSEVNPDIIVIPNWSYKETEDIIQFKNRIMNDPAWQNVKAVKNKKIIFVNAAYLYSVSQYAVKAVIELSEAAYPEIYQKS